MGVEMFLYKKVCYAIDLMFFLIIVFFCSPWVDIQHLSIA